MKQQAKIRDWAIITDPYASPYQAPECIGQILIGTIVFHPKCESGHTVTTSVIEKLDINTLTVETKNTIYELVGEPAKEYQEWLDKKFRD
jgi:hypothetical protein